jgi:hypothetical protein
MVAIFNPRNVIPSADGSDLHPSVMFVLIAKRINKQIRVHSTYSVMNHIRQFTHGLAAEILMQANQ